MDKKQALAKTYEPQAVEKRWYDFWEKGGYFHQDVLTDKEPFCIVMPPPNVTGSLHLGHALDNTLQDILTRFKRMQGYNTLWLPGTDHAGIATQARVEEELKKEGLSKEGLGREKFLERVWEWKNTYGDKITKQLRTLGASCDWERERFTMDEGCSLAVKEVFKRLYDKGLIYRGDYIVNWCPNCRTTISDIEVEHKETAGKLWHIKYPFADGTDFMVVATTRPETMLGDMAVAVHPRDERYQNLIGKKVVLPLVNKEIPVIADEYVDMEFGTGVVKITPSHDPNDFEVALRHNLPGLTVIDREGKMSPGAGKYAGLDRYACRKQVVLDLEAEGLLYKTDDHLHGVGQCYRCDTVIEPLVSKQWFVKMKPLAKPAMEIVEKEILNFIPERFSKVYLNWLANIRDWCISRQLWWGHRIPVWYCLDCGAEICQTAEPKTCPECDSHNLKQDPDVLDTWFSSALWPFSTLGWPEDTPELKQFYPTQVLVTGRDIIFFWVARMIFMGLGFMDKEPFREVFIHGLVLDAQGRKMSKSLGNGIDPIEVINEYGADTLRFMLITGNTPGNDLRFQFERLEGARNFCNKIWNASRFALMHLEDFQPSNLQGGLELADYWILSRLNNTIGAVTRYLDGYELGEAARILYDFIWNEFCDWYIELIKPRLYGKAGEESRKKAQQVLWYTLSDILRLLHPFMPFISEEIWQSLPQKETVLVAETWPVAQEELSAPAKEKQMEVIMSAVRTVRNLRAELNVPPGKKAAVIINANNEATLGQLEEGLKYIQLLAQGESVSLQLNLEKKPEAALVGVSEGGVEVFLPIAGLIDLEAEQKRLRKELNALETEKVKIENKYHNPGFLAKAPTEIIEKEKAKLEEVLVKGDALKARLDFLNNL
ncbi:MAG: valine--tRNA ligase [Bacillota bacterium]